MTIQAVTSTGESQAVDTITLAFVADPVARWTWTNARQYLSSMPRLVRAFGGNAFKHDSAYFTSDYTGVALWLPPDVSPDEEAIETILQSTVPASVLNDVFAVFEQMAKYHPSEPHWYLPLIGVDPSHQGKGYGDKLMVHSLQRCDAAHQPAYLESTNPRNMSLYRRHGFEVLGTIQVGSSPPLIPMLRKAR